MLVIRKEDNEMNIKHSLCAAILSVSLLGATTNDGFESNTLSPFWTFAGPGTATLSRAIAHSGSQSLMLKASTSFPWNAGISHDYGSQGVVGAVSAWVQGQNMCCQSAVGLQITDAAGNWAALMQAGNAKTPNMFTARVSGSPTETDFSFTADPASWHLFEIDTSPSGVTLKLDGKIVLTSPHMTSFETVSLGVWGGPGGYAFVDDVTLSVCECVDK